ncbi:MAG TPA: hypothetical protein VFJ16_24515 [Longimicrobium sp.]|nr:hypothetical protein [Longimicrobium sp.]
MLAEAAPEIACVLWQFVRHVRDWAAATPAQRRELFASESKGWVEDKWREASRTATEIVHALGNLESLTREARDVDAIASAAEKVARWAESRGYQETSIQMAEASALLGRTEPRLANLAGRLTRKAGDFARAEIWFERAIGLARARSDRVEYTRGHLGAGILAMNLGRETRARRHFDTASSVAMREGHEWLAAEAQHDLFQFVTMRASFVAAELHARRALRWYPKHHPRFPFFAADVAFLMVAQRHFAPAVTLLRIFVRVIKPPQNLLGYSLFVRALAGAGRTREFQQRRGTLHKLLSKKNEYDAAARWNLAHAEREAGDAHAALVQARISATLARARCDRETETLAQQLIYEIENTPQPAPPDETRGDHRWGPLAKELAARLEEWSPTRRGRTPVLRKSEWAA